MIVTLSSGLIYTNIVNLKYEYRKRKGLFSKKQLIVLATIKFSDGEIYEATWSADTISNIAI